MSKIRVGYKSADNQLLYYIQFNSNFNFENDELKYSKYCIAKKEKKKNFLVKSHNRNFV